LVGFPVAGLHRSLKLLNGTRTATNLSPAGTEKLVLKQPRLKGIEPPPAQAYEGAIVPDAKATLNPLYSGVEVRTIKTKSPSRASETSAKWPSAAALMKPGAFKEGTSTTSPSKTPDVPVPVGDTESLAEAVCCDLRVKPFAEPQFLFQAPDINLFAKLDKGITTFYDSVCGVPLFHTPVNRTLDDFKADTTEHGWPSFRSAEVTEHVKTDKTTGFVTSSCGTHLGSYLPDKKGPRWCMDLSCISGNPKKAETKPLLMV
jgi:peptide methionine sulfoxide reductase MsrB